MLNAVKKTQDITRLKLTAYRAGEVFIDTLLNKTKILVGSADNTDLPIADQSVSHYHAMLFLDSEGGARVVDLESRNGVFINGKKVKEGYLNAGDELTIGSVQFHVLEDLSETEDMHDQDGEVLTLSEEDITDALPELPPVEGLVVIDGEYCDIHFNESNFRPLKDISILDNKVKADSYIDIDEDVPHHDIFKDGGKGAVEVVILSNGNILHMEYLDLADKTWFAAPYSNRRNVIAMESLEVDEPLPFITVKRGQVFVHPLEGHDLDCPQGKNFATGSNELELSEKDAVIYTKKTIQVMVRLTDAPPRLRPAPFFGRDSEFQKQTAKIVTSVMALMLLLLLVDTTVEEPEKKIAVIYKRAVRNEKAKTAQKNSNEDKGKGNKLTKQPEHKNQMAKAPNSKQTRKVVEKTTKPVPKTAASNKVAKAQAPKKRAYKFDMNNSLNSMFATNVSATNVKIDSSSKTAGTGLQAAKVSDDGALAARSDNNIGTMGSDRTGGAGESFGAQGLVSKNGIDTSYIEPQTVVLGSMDPELLRKILQEYLPQFRHCYQQELQETADDLSGVVDLNFQIGKGGKVTATKIKAKDKRFSTKGIGCLAGVLKIIDFPKPKGGGVVDVRQPLNFFAEQNRI